MPVLGAVLLAAVSCAKEFVPDTPKNGDKLLCAIMPDATKTWLGPKEGTVYPLYWSDGDRLCVNGQATSPASILEDASKANFTVPSAVSLPFSIVYPVPEEGAGAYDVDFPAEQNCIKGSFAPGSAPMYAYSTSYTDVQMHSLASVICLKIKAGEDDAKLSHINLYSDKGIAGRFTVDCRSGDLTPCGQTRKNISCIMENEGFELGSEPESFFITLPAGSYGTIDATIFTTTGSVMTLHLAADEMKAGTVREYPAVSFKAEAEYFVIGNAADMLEFAREAASGTFAKDKAVLSRDIDLSGEDWAGIASFGKVLDGMGHKITGLKAPLFGELGGTVQNLEIEADINEENSSSGSIALGIVARKLGGGTISNVSVSGKIRCTLDPATTELNIGGIAGEVSSGEIVACVNNAGIHPVLSEECSKTTVRAAGIAAKVVGTETLTPSITDCTNNGIIITSDIKASTETDIAGIAARAELCSVITCTNTAALDYSASTGYCYFGALVSLAKNSAVTSCTNFGRITFHAESKIANYFYASGITGYTHSATNLTGCTNNGDITIDSVDWAASRFLLGGIAGYGNENTTGILSCSNNGSINIKGKVKGSANYCALGGIAGRTMAAVEQCTNNGSINVNLEATSAESGVGGVIGTAYSISVRHCTNIAPMGYTVAANTSGLCKAFYLGGVIGSASPTAAASYEYSNLSNSADITVNGSPAVLALKTGGANGRNNASRDDFTDANRIAIGGVTGRVLLANASASGTMNLCSNSGNISAPDAGKIRYTAFGGICGELLAATFEHKDCSNSGNISVDRAYNDGTNLHLGGLVGFIPNKKFTSCTISILGGLNTGSISLSEINNHIQEARAGGILADAVSVDSKFLTLRIDGCTNKGNISRTSSKRVITQSFGGGIAGSIGAGSWSYNASLSDFDVKISNCSNYGNIQFDARSADGYALTDQTYMESATGGIAGNIRGTIYTNGRVRPAVIESCSNYGRVSGSSGFLGGICGLASYYATITGACLNEGEIGMRYSPDGEPVITSDAYSKDLTTCGGIAGELFQGKVATDAAPGYSVVCNGAVNRGTVGGVLLAGGIAGAYNEGNSTLNNLENCASFARIYGFYGKAGAVTGSVQTADAAGGRVISCKAGGTVVRGLNATELTAENFYNFIYQTPVDNDELNAYWDGN